MQENDAGAPYPSDREADVLLRDGATAHLRPIAPSDAEALQAFHTEQSSESVYLRFFAPMPRLSDRDLHRFTHVDHADRVALVVTIGEAIVGVGRYDLIAAGVAEVAFNISDAHQGRGLGSVLLEHLAAAGRENGVQRFHAEVLPRNRKMMTVFTQAGYEVSSSYDDGVISLEFAIEETERSLAVMEAREHRAEARSMQYLLNPASVAVIGPSRNPATVGHRLLADLLAGGYTGRVHVVHHATDSLRVGGFEVPAVRRIGDLGEAVDLAVIAVPAETVLDVVRDCARAGVRGLVVVSGGFAEAGPDGVARQHRLVQVARANGLRVVGPNSWGVINAAAGVRLNVSLVEEIPEPGRLGLFSQSGGLAVAVLDALSRRGLGLSTFLSAGNRADVSGNDCMQYWEEDPDTDVVGLYLESFGNPRKFSRIAGRLARSKPVIVVKSGYWGTADAGVPPGHEVRRSGAPRGAVDSMLAQSGCIRVETVPQLLDVAQLLLHQPLPAGPRIGVVGNSGALSTLIADACAGWQLRVVHAPPALHPQAGPEEFRTALQAAFSHPDVDAVVAAFIPPIATHAGEVARVLADVAGRAGIPLVACFLGTRGVTAALSGDPAAGTRTVPSYPTPEEAVRALARVTRYADWRRRDSGRHREPDGVDLPAARALVTDRLGPGTPGSAAETDAELDDANTSRLLAAFGVPVVDRAPEGVACMIRTVEDPLFGPVVSFGLAGDASELLGDVAHRIPPLTDVDVADLVRSIRGAPKLFGHRGAPAADVTALEDLLARMSMLADEVPEVAELELNPVVVGEHGVAVLRARVRLRRPVVRADSGRRELPGPTGRDV